MAFIEYCNASPNSTHINFSNPLDYCGSRLNNPTFSDEAIGIIMKSLPDNNQYSHIRFEGAQSYEEKNQFIAQLSELRRPDIAIFVDWVLNRQQSGVIGYDVFLKKT